MIPRPLSALKVLSAGCLVYLAMAACSAGTSSPSGAGPANGNGEANGQDPADDSAPGPGTAPTSSSPSSPVPNAMADAYQSGSRIKTKYLEASDGARQFMGYWDTARQEDCGFGKMADGAYHCVPSGGAIAIYFSDASCSQQLGSISTGSAPPKYIGMSSRIFQSGARHTGSVFSGSPAACTNVTPYVTGYDHYTIGGEVALSSFVSATMKTSQ